MKRPMSYGMVATLLAACTLLSVPSPAAHAATCETYLTPLTDPLALRMDQGQTVIWEGVKPELLQARDRYASLLKQHGWSITYTSAYRPYAYQQHLYEVVQNRSVCAYEMSKHGLGTLVAKPSHTAPHTAGTAFDAVVRDERGVALNGMTFVSPKLVELAKQAGLRFPHTATDGVHHELDPAFSGQVTAGPAASAAHVSPSVLRIGQRGSAVAELQSKLQRVGYHLSADGVFGPGTELAVKQFQLAHGLTADGIAGPATNARLSSLAASTVVLRVGHTGDEVKMLQRLLTKYGIPLTADGVFGPGTERAVRTYQQQAGLASDGVVGAATWGKLRG
ncbi:peptidoglycan-binding protein [Paenibacillus sp. YYML68]|uniref:peptidoglycan-binding protein n=1 Tax=Paenibacillus sp. YYML68 TaxID=2909250 RepID=UPI00249110E6|nr:peptidoglycan-binding protein [Paenibacillus sp. YYML68]